jgi:hypothetical protein
MPSEILHILFGEDLLAALDGELSPRFPSPTGQTLQAFQSASPAAFALGCQGPDIFYHSQGRRPVALEYGTLLHRRGFGTLSAALLEGGLPDPSLGAYALGFMTHAFLDRAAHPYIVYKSVPLAGKPGENAPFFRVFPRGRGAHPFFERILDVLMLEKLRGIPVSSWEGGGLLSTAGERPPPGLKDLWGRSLRAVFPERAGGDPNLSRRLDNAFADSASFYRFTDPRLRDDSFPGGGEEVSRARGLLYRYPERLPEDIDFLNEGGKPWAHPVSGREDRRSVPELYRDAVRGAAAVLAPVIGEYLWRGNFPRARAAQVIGDGGLSLTGEDGKPCAPLVTEPLPLHEVFEEERRRRTSPFGGP